MRIAFFMKTLGIVAISFAVNLQLLSAVTISNITEFKGNVGLEWGEEPGTLTSVAGQTFVVPEPASTNLTGFSFWIHDQLGFGTFYYDFVVAEWNPVDLKPTFELFRQKKRWDSAKNGDWNEVGIRGASVPLRFGKTYIALLDGSPYQAETVYEEAFADRLRMRVGVVVGGDSLGSGGLYYGLFGDDSSAVIDSGIYGSDLAVHDLAYSASFEVPDPSNSFRLTLLAFVVLVGLRRFGSRS